MVASATKGCDGSQGKIMNALGLEVTSRASWALHLKGIVEPKVSEARAIENIFAEYGITDIWVNSFFEVL
jgi:hypothetical protein